uniref:Retrotransposon Copia-like N-terminal domain-containing protein n=1 Tax=Quercus lobata TaxID=97700 RepID=A0A7N2QY36_QUELO
MASSSSNSTTIFVPPNITNLVNTKLTGTNYLVWVAQFLPALRSHGFIGLVDDIRCLTITHMLPSVSSKA